MARICLALILACLLLGLGSWRPAAGQTPAGPQEAIDEAVVLQTEIINNLPGLDPVANAARTLQLLAYLEAFIFPPLPGPIASWHFDEGAGATAADSSGSGYDGALVNGPAWVAGVSGTALQFGSGSRVEAADIPLPGALSIIVWVMPLDPAPSDGAIVGATVQRWELRLEGGAALQLRAGGVQHSDPWAYNLPPALGEWHQLAVTYDPDSGSIQFYRQGQPTTALSGAAVLADTGDPVWIGVRSGLGGKDLNAVVDELAVWGRVLGPAEILANFDQYSALIPPPANTPPVASFAVSPTPCVVGGLCQLTNLSSDDDGDVLTSTWTVDGQTYVQTDVAVTFTSAGFEPAVLVVDDGQATDQASANVEVVDAAPPPTQGAGAACVAAMTEGDWNDCGTVPIPLLSKAEVAAKANQLTNGFEGAGPKGIIEGWTGAVLLGDDMTFWGGGHKGYAGNDFYDLNLPTLIWRRGADQGIGPVPADAGPNGGANPRLYPSSINGFSTKIEPGTVFDARIAGPPAAHTYGGIERTIDGRVCFIGGKNATVSGDGGTGDPRFEGGGLGNLWCYDPAAVTWTFMGTAPAGKWIVTTRLMLDPTSGRMIAMGDTAGGTFDPNNVNTNGRLIVWDHAASFANTSEGDAAIAVLADGRRIVVSMQNGQFRYWDVTDEPGGSISISETGSSSHSLHKESGMAWHPGLQKMIIWPGWDDVFELDVETRQLTQLPASATAGPGGAINGVHTRWRYHAGLNVMVGYGDWNDPAWFYRVPGGGPSPTAGLPPVDPPANGSAGRPAGLARPGDSAAFQCSDFDGSLPPCSSLQNYVNAAAPGDTITLTPGSYGSCANVKKAVLTIDFNGAHVYGSCSGKAAIIQNAPDLTLLNMSCDAPGQAGGGGNEACVRRQANGLTLENVWFRNGEEGILGDISLDGDVTISNSLFENMGGNGGKSHLVYMAGVDDLIIDHSEFRCPVQGHALKIGARNAAITNSIIDSTRCAQAPNAAPSSREIDNFAGGALTLRGNIVTKYAGSDNFDMIGYAPGRQYDPTLQPRSVTLEDNVFNCERPRTTVLSVGSGSPVVAANDNTYIGGCTALQGG